ncbi:MAG TPA: hypothetical protein VFC07_10370 [Verrucomicrobiae bacterium]|nr:hypothetical protein [Verrucomicrobiae bacterium]
MNDEQIENLLHKAPALKAPAGLEEKLKADIRLPQANTNARADQTAWRRPPSWTRRWLPALSFAAILLTCLVAIGVQSNLLTELKQQNADLRAKAQKLESLRLTNADVQRLRNENQELDRLRKDNAELQRLRGEVAQLGAQLQGIQNLRAENQQLKARNLSARAASADTSSDAANAEAESIRCINNMKQVGLAFRMWANDNNDLYPKDFISMTNELGNWRILQCPSDKSHNVSSWADVAAGNISYRRVSSGPGADEQHPNVVLFECPIHGHVALCDGSVQAGSAWLKAHLKVSNGVTTLLSGTNPDPGDATNPASGSAVDDKAAQTAQCLNNLRQIDGAKQTWALEMKKSPNDVPTWQDVLRYLGPPNSSAPRCPSGGTYQLNDLNHPPTCSIPGHQSN